MADFRFSIARDLMEGKYDFEHYMKFIAVSAVGRFMLCAILQMTPQRAFTSFEANCTAPL